jgi:hypothetical protein
MGLTKRGIGGKTDVKQWLFICHLWTLVASGGLL